MRGVYLEVDGLAVDALVATRNPGRLVLDLALDIAKVGEATARDVMELCPLRAPGGVGVLEGRLEVDLSLVLLDIDELQNQGAAGDDAAASGEEIAANDILEDRRLAGGLRTNNYLDSEGGGGKQVVARAEDTADTEGGELGGREGRTIWGRSRLSVPMVLKTRSCSWLTMRSRSSPRAAIAKDEHSGVCCVSSAVVVRAGRAVAIRVFWFGPFRVLVEVGGGDAGAAGCWTEPRSWIFFCLKHRGPNRERQTAHPGGRDHFRD